MPKLSAGLLLYKLVGKRLEVLLVHPGGPFYAKKDAGVWSIPKGEFENGEKPLAAARREFAEELGRPVPDGETVELGEAKQPGGKTNYIWALETDFDASTTTSNTFQMEWPPKSGRTQDFPEVDRAEWLNAALAKPRLRPAQVVFIDRLEAKLQLTISEPADETQQPRLL